MSAVQQSLFSREEEARQFHDAGRPGFFSLLTATELGEKLQKSYPLAELAWVLSQVDERRDSWISQAEFFKPNRRIVNLLALGLCFVDLDTYKMDWARDRSPEGLAAAVLMFCEGEDIPPPSLLVFSGRGIQAKWLFDKVLPRQALPRWNLVQTQLVDKLAKAGADHAARDASRVLRLVHTANSKSGRICQVVHITPGSDGLPLRYNFEYLCESLLPMGRAELSLVKPRPERRQLKLLPGGQRDSGNLRRFNGRALAWHRLDDLRTLQALRGERVEEGQRMLHLHWQLNFLLSSGATNHAQMYHEAREVAKQVDAGWRFDKSELSTLYHKAKMFAAGDKVTFAGREYPALYTPRNDTLINLFGITDIEQSHLKTIISESEVGRRNTARCAARRRAEGAIARSEYLSQSHSKQERACELRDMGMSVRTIAGELGVSKSAIARYIAGVPDSTANQTRRVDGKVSQVRPYY